MADPNQLATFRGEAEHLLKAAEHVLQVSSSAAALLAWHDRELLAKGLGASGHGGRAQMGYEAAAYARDAERLTLAGEPRSSVSTSEGLKDVSKRLQQVGSTPPGGAYPLTVDRDRFFYVDLVDGTWRRPGLSVSKAEAVQQIQLLRDAIRRLDI